MKVCSLCAQTFLVGHDEGRCNCGGEWLDVPSSGLYVHLREGVLDQIDDARYVKPDDPSGRLATATGADQDSPILQELKFKEAGGKPARGQVLLDAHEIINGERQNVYGNPEDSFALIARYWSLYLASKGYIACAEGREIINADDAAMMMTLFKIAREANQHKRDNVVDAAGYLGIYGDMQVPK